MSCDCTWDFHKFSVSNIWNPIDAMAIPECSSFGDRRCTPIRRQYKNLLL
jgi:hypothetical protein